MRVFVVRPFGEKEGIDFERVERELIQPALVRLGTQGIRSVAAPPARSSRQGNIREDMFRLLVVADLVIADVSIHNANVFYELGIRHALRPRHTFLIAQRDRRTSIRSTCRPTAISLYDAGNPGGERPMVAELASALRSTLAAEPPRQPGLPAAARS